MSFRVLSVGYEWALLRLRSILLRQFSGISVLEAANLASALAIANSDQQLDLVLLCHTVARLDQEIIIESARRKRGAVPAISVFSTAYPSGGPGKPTSNDPEILLAEVGRLLDGASQGVCSGERLEDPAGTPRRPRCDID